MRNPVLTGCLILLCLFTSLITYAQVTTATLSGTIQSKEGKPLAGATVKIEYREAGISKVIITQNNGSFQVPNLRVGGPYKVTATFVGYSEKSEENIFLELGQNTALDLQLELSSANLSGITVTGRSKIFDNQRTGASSNISSRQLRQLPTISRSADDFTRLTPSASATINGTSFAGRNGQYNNYSLDGAVFNNPFGLDAPTPGGQTGAQPISLDAIDQIQVNLAPYDVTQAGFTGAGVNTVTKSGTNTFGGTVYGFYRNQGMTGKKVDGNKIAVPDLTQLQAGFAVGGAIVKNKLFYFANFETEQRDDAASSYVARTASNGDNNNTSRVLESDLIAVSDILRDKFNYETGPWQGFNLKQKNYKWLAKLDWVINENHSLSFTYNGLQATKEKPAHPNAIRDRGPDYQTLQFRNSGYEIENRLQSFGAELKSSFGNRYANKLRAVYTTFKDKRTPFSEPFPVLNITKYGTMYIVAGHEPFSINNRLNQDAFQVTDNFNIILPRHTITVGGSYESFKFGNSFNLTGYGATLFSDADIQVFKDSVPASGKYVFGAYPLDVDVAAARAAGAADKWNWYYITVAQLSTYLQDEWKATENLRVTFGLRMDIPLYMNSSFQSPDGKKTSPTIPNNDDLTLFDEHGERVTNGQGKQLDNTRLPSSKPLFSPRIGFNWDVKADKSLQLRGGSGLFTGRFPFVWIGNQIGNPTSGFYCATDRDFKWPQIWRTNIGADIRAGLGTIFSVDVAYSKDVNAMMVRNYKLGTPTGSLNSGIGDTRSVYKDTDKGAVNAYIFTNTKTGDQFNTSFTVQKTFANNLFLYGAYNYLVSRDASSISAEISGDAFDRNPILNNANEARNTPSLYGNTHRFVVAASKKFNYGKGKYATTVSLFGNWSSGNRFAYIYGGDINNDGTTSNDLLYVPKNSEIDLMQFAPLTDVNGVVQNAAAQKAAYKAFIEQDHYLRSRRGMYTEKYAGVSPWFSQVDMRVLQDFYFKSGEKIRTVQISLDVVNLGNLISSKWGVRKYASNSGYFQPISVTGVTNGVPTYQFDPSLKETFIASPDLLSRWQTQLGLRFIF
ncbi:TonB-dependent receptor [Chitinophaga sp. ARDCPP14]|uniref:TonB-dependent receptor n=1 Tax=Chitinophaga sp. ARDCPP14 TaxID=3391139 RepID=UPI003F5278CF